MRKYLLALVILFFLANASALTINTNKTVAIKADSIVFNGDCLAGDVTIEGRLSRNLLFSETLTCSEKSQFVYEYEIGNLDPSGNWTIYAIQGEEKQSVNVLVNPTDESQYLLLTFVSPSPVQHYRGEDLNFVVKVTDSGAPVVDATVNMFDLYGNRKELAHSGNGVYIYQYEIPFDAAIANWQAILTAQRYSGEKKIGGENKITINIGAAPIKIHIANPKLSNYDIESQIPIEVGLTYFNGKPVSIANVKAIANSREYKLEKGATTYSMTFTPDKADVGSVKIIVVAEDSAGNNGEQAIDIVLSSNPLKMFLKDYLLFIIVGLIAVAIFYFFTKSKVKGFTNVKAMEAERQRIDEQISKMQVDYYDRGMLTKETFRRRLAELESKLREIDKKLSIK